MFVVICTETLICVRRLFGTLPAPLGHECSGIVEWHEPER